ncbi:MAG: hypothetical protein HY644_03610 [Acidobacteria bacterium]|nr:hypothetical protein [Acidobacteriota bacterium]
MPHAPVLLMVLAILHCGANAQSGTLRVELGSGILTFSTTNNAPSESPVLVPLSLVAEGGEGAEGETEVMKLQTEIVFPNKYLSFSRLLVKSEDVKFETTLREDPDDVEKSRVLVLISAGKSGRPIQPGIIAEVEFKASAFVPEGVIELPHYPEVYSPAGRLDNVKAESGFITVTTPLSACFFYMH